MFASSSTSAAAAAAAAATGPFRSIFGYFLVGILWGCTNPFIKHAQQSSAISRDIRSSNADKNATASGKSSYYIINKAYSLFFSVFSSLTDRNIFIPYAINQAGSLVKFQPIIVYY